MQLRRWPCDRHRGRGLDACDLSADGRVGLPDAVHGQGQRRRRLLQARGRQLQQWHRPGSADRHVARGNEEAVPGRPGPSRQAIEAAPSAIKADLQTLDAASSKFYAALATANFDMTKLPPDATAGFSAPELQAASTRVLAYVKDHCGIDLGGAGTAGGTATTKP